MLGSMNQIVEIADVEPTKNRKGIGDDSGGEPVPKQTRQGPSPTNNEDLRKRLRHPDEGPSRWENYDEEEEIIDCTTSESETDEDDDYNNEDDDDDTPLTTKMMKMTTTMMLMMIMKLIAMIFLWK